jgi:hypothetical protein
VNDFNPQIDVTVIPSVFSRKFRVSVNKLPPNETMAYWFFEPGGDICGMGEIKSDSQGDYVDRDGNHIISYTETGSQPIKKGIYHFGIDRIKNKKTEVRMSLSIWNELPGEIKLVNFEVDYNNQSFLILLADKKVPWGMNLKAAGQLWLEKEQFPSCSGSVDSRWIA